MTLANLLRDRVQLQEKITTSGPLGESIVWKPVETRHARVIPLDARARAVYQQLKSEVSHQIVMRGAVSLNLGSNRFKWGDKTLEPVEPPQIIDGNTTIAVKEM